MVNLTQICRFSTYMRRYFHTTQYFLHLRINKSSSNSLLKITYWYTFAQSSTSANPNPSEIIDKATRKSSTITTADDSKTTQINKDATKKDSLLTRLTKRFLPAATNLNPQEIREEKYLNFGVPLIYANCSNGFDYIKFIEMYKLPDTIDTWYRLTYLHLWMVLVRISHENKDFFDDFRDEILPMLWRDCNQRLIKLKDSPKFHIGSSLRRKWVDNYYYELFFGVQEYDDGLLTDDVVLAGALWRNVFDQSKTYDVNSLNHFVRYVRMHIYSLQKIELDTLMTKGYKFRFPS